VNFVNDCPLAVPDIGSIASIQHAYDLRFPGNSEIDDSLDGYHVAVSDLSVSVQNAQIPIHPKEGYKDAKPTIKSKLRTGMSSRRIPSERENVLAASKRNWDTPDVSEIVNIEEAVEVAVSRFVEAFVDMERVDDSILCTADNAAQWFEKQIPSTKGKILGDIGFVDDQNLSEYNYMIKCDVKPKLDCSPQGEYAALQTVIYHGKDVNWVWGPIFNELTTRFLQCLRPNVVVNTKLTPEELEDRFSWIPTDSSIKWLEMDLSKYDKSQGLLHQQCEMAIWEMFGLDKSLRDLWERGHVSTSFYDFKTGFKSWVMYQRKSGDVTTFIGNTIVNMLAMADSLPLDKAIFSLFGGDDSLIGFYPEDFSLHLQDPCQRVASVWNFQCKMFSFSIPSFCGKAILRDSMGWVVVPDHMKLITKLGATKCENKFELEEVRRSYADNYKHLSDYRVIELLCEYDEERYKVKDDVSIALCSLSKFLFSPTAFQFLFHIEEFSDRKRSLFQILWS